MGEPSIKKSVYKGDMNQQSGAASTEENLILLYWPLSDSTWSFVSILSARLKGASVLRNTIERDQPAGEGC